MPRSKAEGRDSGFGDFKPIKYVSRDLALPIIQGALDLDTEEDALAYWNDWSETGNIMPALIFGRCIHFLPEYMEGQPIEGEDDDNH